MRQLVQLRVKDHLKDGKRLSGHLGEIIGANPSINLPDDKEQLLAGPMSQMLERMLLKQGVMIQPEPG